MSQSVENLTDVVQVSTNGNLTVALLEDSSIWTKGNGQSKWNCINAGNVERAKGFDPQPPLEAKEPAQSSQEQDQQNPNI